MISLEQIKDIIFPTKNLQNTFISFANQHCIPGTDFDEKLQNLFSGDDNTLQLIIAPFLRQLAVHHLENGATAYIAPIKEQFVQVQGGLLFQALKERNQLETCKQEFIERVSKILWNNAIQNNFSEDSPETEIYTSSKQNFIETWGEHVWAASFSPSSDTSAMNTPDTELEDSLGLKDYYQEIDLQTDISSIKTCMENWAAQQWDRIFYPDDFSGAFDITKNAFVEKWDEATWQRLYDEDSSADDEAAIDYRVRKQHFLDNWGETSWAQTKTISSILPWVKRIADELAEEFIRIKGTELWQRELNLQSQPGTFATYLQLEALLDLFDLRCQVTSSSRDIQGTIIELRPQGQHQIHYYCADNTHWYVHEGEPRATSSDSNNCLYHGFAQWLQLLLQGKLPRKIVLPMGDKDTIIYSQKRIMRTTSHAPVAETAESEEHSEDQRIALAIASEESQSIRAIRKTLSLTSDSDHESIAELESLLDANIHLLLGLIPARHRRFLHLMPLLRAMATATKEFAEHNEHDHLLVLKKLLLYTTNTLYIPNTKDVERDWSKEQYRANIVDLKIGASELSTSTNTCIKNLAHIISTMEFDIDKPMCRHTILTPLIQHTSTPENEDQEDCISTALYLSGLLLMISSFISLLMLIILTAITGSFASLGMLLLTTPISLLAAPLSGIIGLHIAHTAVMIAATGGLMTMASGYTLFKDFAPAHIADLIGIEACGLRF